MADTFPFPGQPRITFPSPPSSYSLTVPDVFTFHGLMSENSSLYVHVPNMGVSINGGTPKWMVYNGEYH
jgi:hypothetical protein